MRRTRRQGMNLGTIRPKVPSNITYIEEEKEERMYRNRERIVIFSIFVTLNQHSVVKIEMNSLDIMDHFEGAHVRYCYHSIKRINSQLLKP